MTHHADRYKDNEYYAISGITLNAILRIAYRMNDGGILLASFEQRDLAQRIQAQIDANVLKEPLKL